MFHYELDPPALAEPKDPPCYFSQMYISPPHIVEVCVCNDTVCKESNRAILYAVPMQEGSHYSLCCYQFSLVDCGYLFGAHPVTLYQRGRLFYEPLADASPPRRLP